MIYSRQHNCVVYDHPEPGVIVGAIAGARQVNGSRVAIPADLFSMQLARVMGLPVPNVLDISAYDWPMQPGRKPYAHQRYMASFAVVHPRHFNLSEMGTGKTLSNLWAADYLMSIGAVRKALIISPLSTLGPVWDDEIFRNFCGRRKSTVLHGDRDKRLDRLRRDVDFYIINHDGLGVGTSWVKRGAARELKLGLIAEQIRARPDIDLIIVDEASAYKDWTTLRTKILARVVADKPYLWLLSGTPTPNAPTDAYSLAKLLGNLQNESQRSFQGRTMKQVSTFKWLPLAPSSETVRQVLSPAVRFSRAECIDLPECVVQTRDVELSPVQEKAFRELKKDLQVAIGKGLITAINEAVLRTKLIQISCGAVYGADQEVHKTDAGPRLAALKELIDEAGAKLLVFAPFTSVVNMLYLELKSVYGEKAVARVYGGTSQTARSEIFRAFETESDPRIIVADPGTMSHGVTLVAANTIVWYGPTDKNETYEQACARINRPGQKNKMLIAHLASTPIERDIYKRLREKQSMQGAILKLTEEDR